jgi:hypothetical protein
VLYDVDLIHAWYDKCVDVQYTLFEDVLSKSIERCNMSTVCTTGDEYTSHTLSYMYSMYSTFVFEL